MAKRKQTTRTPREKLSRRERRQAQRDASKHREKSVSPSAHRFTRQNILSILALGLLVIVSYLPAMLWGGFVWDDEILTSSQAVQEGWSGLWRLWSGDAYNYYDTKEGHYWPLVYTTFWLENKLWGFAPRGYHIVNVLLHLVNTLLLWHLLRRLAVPGTWMVAAVFAVHPLHVESVAWVIERKDVLSGLFYLAAVLAWMRFVEQPRRGWYAGSLVLYAAALLSKSIAITLPVALLIWHWWKQGRVTSTDLLRLVPFFTVGLAIVVGGLSFYRSMEVVSFDYSLTERTLIAARALWFYAGNLLWPTNLAFIYPRWDARVADPLAWGYLIAAVALVLALWHFRSQFGRGPLAGALFFAGTLSPVLGFVDYGYMQFSFVADRFQYLAGIGVMAVIIGTAAYGVSRLSSLWQKGALGVMAVIIVVLGVLTWRQSSIYRDNETLNRHIIALNPQARDAHYGLGKSLYEQERYEEALTPARVAVEQRPDFFEAHVNLGAILNVLRRYEEAEQHLRRAIALNPQDSPQAAELYFLMGRVSRKNGEPEEVEKYYMHTLEVDPNHVAALHRLAMLRAEQQRYDKMLELCQRLINLDPNNAAIYNNNMGVALLGSGRHDEALQCLDRALALDPTLENVRLNREALLKAMEATQDMPLALSLIHPQPKGDL